MSFEVCPICGNEMSVGDHAHPELVEASGKRQVVEGEEVLPLKPKFDRKAHMRKVALEYHARKRAARAG